MRNRVAALFLLQALLLPVLAMGQASPVLVLKTRIPLANVKGRMDHLGVDAKGQRLFAAAFDNHTVEVIDLKAGRQAHTITDLDQPQAPFYDASTNRLFITSEGDGTVKMFDGTTFQLLQTVKLSSDADNILATGTRTKSGRMRQALVRAAVEICCKLGISSKPSRLSGGGHSLGRTVLCQIPC
jgi:WD40 repeat protein